MARTYTKHHTRLTPRLVNTFFLLALQHYFIHHPEYPWSPNDYDTKIDVTSGFSVDSKSDTKMPMVIVENGASSIVPTGVATGSFCMLPRPRNGVRDKQYGVLDSKHDFTVNSSTEISIFSVSKDAADEIAFEIAMFIMMLKYNVGTILQIQNIESCNISPARMSDQVGYNQEWCANVVFPYSFTVSRMYQPVDEGELLRAIETTLDCLRDECPKHGGPGEVVALKTSLDDLSANKV